MPIIRPSLTRLRMLASRASRSIWFRPTVYACIALGALAAAPLLDREVPARLSERVSAGDLEGLLGVLASSMLAVAIFSLSAMVSALQDAAGVATPRARSLLTEDRTAQTAISTFVGAFIFSIVGLAGLWLELYADGTRVVLFFLALALVALVVVTLIAWIQRISNMGGVGEAVDLVERVTARALTELARHPFAGGARSEGAPPGSVALRANQFGYVQLIDAERLSAVARRRGIDVHLALRVGALVDPQRALAWTPPDLPDEAVDDLRAAFVLGGARTFEHDPRFGLVALSEIGSRALSPAVNDPGTAIDVLTAQTRLLATWRSDCDRLREPPSLERLHAPPVSVEDLLEDAFRAIARDGAAMLEVAIRLHKSLAVLAAVDPELFGPPVRALSAEAAARSDGAMALESDRKTIAALRRDLGLTPP